MSIALLVGWVLSCQSDGLLLVLGLFNFLLTTDCHLAPHLFSQIPSILLKLLTIYAVARSLWQTKNHLSHFSMHTKPLADTCCSTSRVVICYSISLSICELGWTEISLLMRGLDCGADRYMAPEVFLHKTYDKSVDVFSFAITVQEVCSFHCLHDCV